MQPLSIGARIKNFRQQVKMSQQDLEIAIEASAGSVSRIENDQVNPTKETLVDICKALQLNAAETAYLLNVTNLPVSDKEMLLASEAVKIYFERSDVFAYLLDDRYRFISASEGFRRLFKISDREEFIRQHRGKFIMLLAMDHTLPIHQALDKESYQQLLKFQFSRMLEDLAPYKYEPWYKEMMMPIRHFPEFESLSELISSGNTDNLSRESRKVVFNFGGSRIPTTYTRERLLDHPRFTVVEYLLEPAQALM